MNTIAAGAAQTTSNGNFTISGFCTSLEKARLQIFVHCQLGAEHAYLMLGSVVTATSIIACIHSTVHKHTGYATYRSCRAGASMMLSWMHELNRSFPKITMHGGPLRIFGKTRTSNAMSWWQSRGHHGGGGKGNHHGGGWQDQHGAGGSTGSGSFFGAWRRQKDENEAMKKEVEGFREEKRIADQQRMIADGIAAAMAEHGINTKHNSMTGRVQKRLLQPRDSDETQYDGARGSGSSKGNEGMGPRILKWMNKMTADAKEKKKRKGETRSSSSASRTSQKRKSAKHKGRSPRKDKRKMSKRKKKGRSSSSSSSSSEWKNNRKKDRKKKK